MHASFSHFQHAVACGAPVLIDNATVVVCGIGNPLRAGARVGTSGIVCWGGGCPGAESAGIRQARICTEGRVC